MADIKGKQLSDNLAVTNVTASGHISGSQASTGSFGRVAVSDGFYHALDTDGETYIKFPTGDKIDFVAGGVNFIYAWQRDSDFNKLIFNEDNTDTDIIFRSANGSNNKLLYLDASADNIGIKEGVPSASLHIAGNLWVSGSSGHVTASGDISASGDVTADNLYTAQYIRHIDDSNTYLNFTADRLRFNIGGISYIDLNDAGSAPHDVTFNDGGNDVDFIIKGSSNNPLFKTDASTNRIGMFGVGSPTADFHIAGNAWVSGSNGHITASGDISSSASGSFTNVEIANNTTIDGDLIVSQYIKHKGDVNTAINFTDNKIKLEAGGMSFASFYDDDSAPFTAKINNDSNRINFLVYDKANQLLLKTDSDEGWVNLYYSGSEKLSTQTGGVNITGNVSASGNMVLSGSQIKFQNDAATGETYTFNNISSTISSDHSLGFNIASGSSSLDSILKVSGSHVGGFVGINKPATDVLTKALMVEGDVSGSGTGSFGQLEIGNGGDIILTEDQRVYFEADKNTYIESHASDSFRIVVNDRQMFLFDEDTGNRAVFGNGTKVFIGANNNFIPSASLHIAGNVWVSGSDAQGGAHVTASGNISSSATITSEDSIVKNNLTVGGNLDIADTIYHTGDSNTKIRFPAVDTIAFHTNGSERMSIGPSGHITSSVNISGSGGSILGFDTGSFAYMTVGSSIIRDGDPDTKLKFTDDDLNITIGGVNMVDFTQDTVSEITFNEAGADVDLRIETVNDSKALYINAGDDTIQLGSSANTHVTASGNISGSGGNILGFKDITATGNITAQGDVIAENYIVSSSVTYMTSSVMSGSTRFGDTPADDTHLITGSMFISGSSTDLTNTMTASFASVKLQHAGHLSGSLGTITGVKQANITSGSFDYVNVTGNVTASSIETSGDIVAFGSSDRELKDNIQPITNPLEKMDKIGGYTFVWNDNQSTYKGKDIGVVAQEIQSVLPEIVATRANGYLGVKYEKIVPLLIESIKENTKKIKELEQEINEINKNCDCLNK